MLRNSKATVEYNQGRLDAARVQWEELADMGNAEAMRSLGYLHRQAGFNAVNQSLAFDWFRRAASQGEPRSLYEVSLAFRNGNGTQPSTGLAEDYLVRAAYAGIPEAQFLIGAAARKAGDFPAAWHWLTAAEQSAIEGAAGAVEGMRLQGHAPSTSAAARRRRISLLLEEMIGALNARDTEFYLLSLTDSAFIQLGLPHEQQPKTISRQDFVDLWANTFSAADRFRAHRGFPSIELHGEAMVVRSQIHQYVTVGEQAQRLTIEEKMHLLDTVLGLKVTHLSMQTHLSTDPVVLNSQASH